MKDTRRRYPNIAELGLHGESLGAFTTIEALAYEPLDGNTVPILLIHGDVDATVSPRDARELYERAEGKCELHYVAGTDHAESVLLAPDEYREVVASFLETDRHS